MSNNIVLKRGLDIPIKGEAARETVKMIKPDIIAMKPTDFKGLTPRLLVREGDKVLAGSPVMADKNCPDILFTSPVSGTVAEIVRGEKRKLLEVRIKVDAEQSYVDFGVKNVASMSADEVRCQLLKSGLWPALIQRPYGILADPQLKPKAIFISAFSTAPLAADTDYVLGDSLADVQTAVDALAKLTDGGVHFSISGSNCSSTPFHKVEHVIMHTVSGRHPAGNVGVQISNISPIRKGETVWTVSLLMLAAIGKLFNTGKLNLSRKVAVTGPVAVNPAYVDALPGISMKDLAQFYDNSAGDVRFVSGDVLSGRNIGAEGFLGFFDNQVSLLHEGTEREWFGWIKPFRFNQYSSQRSYFSWLCPKKRYSMDTNTHGGERTFMMSDVYGKVLPMDIFPIYLVKACLAGNLDDMEKFGIYEVLPEDLATCEFVDPSKNDIQAIIECGIDRMIKEMA
ncbi:MAG: Na(+)-translocating NADH-quinone reductase subunit A [Candidatus Cryptobacteroides sp.]|nr:Na(+)-translocating NADH-quinone reductase subunit A [Bacteroidales bacterium]MDD6052278.1 Na(+)-translocating NADH-quinone reductase subunit A [Bacteroidales bacterium]